MNKYKRKPIEKGNVKKKDRKPMLAEIYGLFLTMIVVLLILLVKNGKNEDWNIILDILFDNLVPSIIVYVGIVMIKNILKLQEIKNTTANFTIIEGMLSLIYFGIYIAMCAAEVNKFVCFILEGTLTILLIVFALISNNEIFGKTKSEKDNDRSLA